MVKKGRFEGNNELDIPGIFIWVCLKIVYPIVPLHPMVNDHYPY